MSETERRAYIISGEFPPEKWETMLDLLGNLGVTGEQLRPADSEEELDGTLVDKSDMMNFAEQQGYETRLADKAWTRLVRMHQYPERYGETPLRYSAIPADMQYGQERSARGLQVESVAELLGRIDERTEKYGRETDAITWVMGKGIGVGTVKFLRQFVAETLPPPTELPSD